MSTPAAGPLSGFRVIDLTSVVLGPYATQILGDLGADVVKVEPPEGDVTRNIAPFRKRGMGAMFLNINRNKRSLAVDLKAEHGCMIVRQLAREADALIHSMRPQAMRRLGLHYEALSSVNPRLVYCGAYGFAEGGRYAGRPAYDDIIQSASGLAWVQGVNQDSPRYINSVVADKVAGLTVVYSVMAALLQRGRTGIGQFIEVPMFETLVSFLMPEHLAGATFSPRIGQPGYSRLLAPYRRPYATRDGYMAVLPYTSEQWRRFFELVGRPDLLEDRRFSDPTSRSENIAALYEIVSVFVRERTTAEWVAALEKADIPSMQVKSLEDVLDDPHLAEIGLFQTMQHPTEGELRVIGPPVRFGSASAPALRPAPRLGEHSREILLEAGFAEDFIADLVHDRIVITPKT
jgi:crotonobetainyl-CoA:carnitine CoA-transferase CaiB-like acyl-CoA transferase